jgi:hypothetical protein
VWGILLLLAVGYTWLIQVDSGPNGAPVADRAADRAALWRGRSAHAGRIRPVAESRGPSTGSARGGRASTR